MNFRTILFGCLLLLLHGSVSSQVSNEDVSPHLHFRDFIETPREKVYVRTNKEWYTATETIWFSTVLLDASALTPGGLSTVVYVDLIDPNGKIHATKGVRSIDGFGHGHFKLREDFGEATWLLRAYTSYMQNFSKKSFFYRHLTILNENQPFEIDKKRKKPLVSFHQVRGGATNTFNLVAHDEFHRPLAGNWLLESPGSSRAFKTNNWGLSSFKIDDKTADFTLSLDYKGKLLKYKLPAPNYSYDLLQVQSSNEEIIVGIDGSSVQRKKLLLYGIHHGQVFLEANLPTDKKSVFQKLDKAQLPAGILNFMLVDSSGAILSQDVCFNDFFRSKEYIQISGPAYMSTRDSVSFSLVLEDSIEWAHLSISVLSDNRYFENRLDIVNYLNLTSELTYSLNPDLLMDEKGQLNAAGMQLINRDNLGRLQPLNVKQTFLPERGFTIEGRVTQYLNKNKGARARVKLQFLEDITFIRETDTDEAGYFQFMNLPIGDTLRALVTATPMKYEKSGLLVEDLKKKVLVDYGVVSGNDFDITDVNHLITESLPEDKVQEISETQSYMETISQIGEDGLIVLDEVEIEAAPDIKSSPYYREGMKYLEPERRLVMDSLPGSTSYTSIWRFLMSQMPGSKLQGEVPELSFLVRPLIGRFWKPVSFIVDGAPMTASQLDNFSVKLIDLIDLVQGPDAYEYDPLGAPVIVIYTRKGSSLASILPEADGVRMKEVAGFSEVWDYAEVEKPTDNPQIPDIRHSLYWNPNLLVTGEDAFFQFQTSDETGPFTIYIEGITANGEVFKKVKKFVVQ